MRVLLFFVFLAVSACADQQLKPLPAGNGSESHATDSHDTAAGSGDQQLKPLPAGSGTDSHATDSHGTAAGSTPKPSGSEGQDHQQEKPVTVHPHVGGMGGLPRPPHRQPGLHFPGLNPGFGQGFVPGFGQGFVPGFGQGFIPGFNPRPLPGFMPQLPFPGFGR